MITSIPTTKKAILALFLGVLLILTFVPFAQAETHGNYNKNKHNAYYGYTYQTYSDAHTEALLKQVRALLAQLQALQAQQNRYVVHTPKNNWLAEYYAQKSKYYPYTYYSYDDDWDDDDDNDDDIPEVTTDDATSVGAFSATLRGTVEMNDFENGIAFFLYGDDEDAVDDATAEDSYSDIDEDGDALQKVQVYSNLDSDRTFWQSVYGLDDETDYFFTMCVEYEDEDDDETLECGDVESFETDEN